MHSHTRRDATTALAEHFAADPITRLRVAAHEYAHHPPLRTHYKECRALLFDVWMGALNCDCERTIPTTSSA